MDHSFLLSGYQPVFEIFILILFQIFRGSLIIFTGLLTVIWLRKKLEWFKWLGMFVILGGLAITGVGDLSAPKECFAANMNLTANVSESFHMYSRIDISTGTFGAMLTTDDEDCAAESSGTLGKGLVGDMLIIAGQVII
jgi:drug/metabolite transporter (DMT)-like permease